MPPVVTPAQPRARFAAAAVDLVPPLLAVVALSAASFDDAAAVVAGLGCVWAVTRDALFRGRSPGKRNRGIQVVDDRTRLAPTAAQSLVRNLGFGVPFLNLLYTAVEGVFCVLRQDDSRLGDLWAGTTVVESTEELRSFIEKHSERSLIPPSLRALLARTDTTTRPEPTDEGEPPEIPAEERPTNEAGPPAGNGAATESDEPAEATPSSEDLSPPPADSAS